MFIFIFIIFIIFLFYCINREYFNSSIDNSFIDLTKIDNIKCDKNCCSNSTPELNFIHDNKIINDNIPYYDNYFKMLDNKRQLSKSEILTNHSCVNSTSSGCLCINKNN
jgi:hypothetical protein